MLQMSSFNEKQENVTALSTNLIVWSGKFSYTFDFIHYFLCIKFLPCRS